MFGVLLADHLGLAWVQWVQECWGVVFSIFGAPLPGCWWPARPCPLQTVPSLQRKPAALFPQHFLCVPRLGLLSYGRRGEVATEEGPWRLRQIHHRCLAAALLEVPLVMLSVECCESLASVLGFWPLLPWPSASLFLKLFWSQVTIFLLELWLIQDPWSMQVLMALGTFWSLAWALSHVLEIGGFIWWRHYGVFSSEWL